ncbi:MAG: flagellar hook-basal body protein [Lachnospiraceae bacterium]|nr:flagellar hook-basal body protein [Lachnospiraceae bacterium]
MVRSLWSAATGMIAQQTAVDTISNNIANINTTGYKTSQNEFKSLLYQELQSATTSANGDAKPINSQVGLGVRSSSITTIFTQGSFYESTSSTAFAIDGDGFFGVKGPDGNTYYTRNGNFEISLGTNGLMLTTTEGNPVLDSKGKPIVFSRDLTGSMISVTGDGEICYPDESGNPASLGITIGLFQFNNPEGLEKLDSSLYAATASSGAAMNESTTKGISKSTIVQGYLEGSNVQLADEMVNLIVAQRAYEANSKAITTSDEMMSQANQLRR